MEEQLTQQPETNQTQQNQEIPNRRERRRRLKQQGILRYLSKLSFFNPIRANFRAENIKTGKRIQEIRRERIEKAWEEFYGLGDIPDPEEFHGAINYQGMSPGFWTKIEPKSMKNCI